MTVFENIKKYAKLRAMSLQEVAEKAGLSKNIIYQYGKGTNPSLETLGKIAAVLNVSADALLGKTNHHSTKTSVDLAKDDEDIILSFDGKPIPDEDKELIRRLLRGK